jgi:hypothetical protein
MPISWSAVITKSGVPAVVATTPLAENVARVLERLDCRSANSAGRRRAKRRRRG